MLNPPQVEGRGKSTVSFVFTDIQDSAGHWERNPERMELDLAYHDDLITAAVEDYGGRVFKRLGDGLGAAFAVADDAIRAALAAQTKLRQAFDDRSPALKVRMAVHTGTAESWGTDYLGEGVNRTARLLGLANGGQVLASGSTVQLVSAKPTPDLAFKSLGHHRLRGLRMPEAVYQVNAAGEDETFPQLRHMSGEFGNLPDELSSFIGRSKEIAAVEDLVLNSRLVTLTGLGGIGKTRLALESAHKLGAKFDDGAWFVALDLIDHPDLVVSAVARTFAIADATAERLDGAILEFLRERRLLLVLDNCEHVLSGVRPLCTKLLAGCKSLHILATSREAIDVSGERVFRTAPLSVPAQIQNSTGHADPQELAAIEASESGMLFIERARARRMSFELNPSNGAALGTLLARLDGVPLAIELAAARCRSLSVEQLAQRVGESLELLAGGATASPRHKTLQATMDWSYGLLSPEEQAFFARLSVFQGGWSLDAAEQVCCCEAMPEGQIMDLLASVEDKCLVQVDQAAASLRFRFLEPVKQYAESKAKDLGDRCDLKANHFRFFSGLVDRSKGEFQGPRQSEWLETLSMEHENLRAAIEWGLADSATFERAARTICLLSPYWIMRGRFGEAARLLDMAFAKRPEAPDPLSIDVQVQLGAMRVYGGDPAGIELIRDALRQADGFGPDVRGRILLWLGLMSNVLQDAEGAETFLTQALAQLREAGDPSGGGYILMHLGNLAFVRDDLAAARTLFEDCLKIASDRGDRRGVGATRFSLGYLARFDDPESARTHFREGLTNSYAAADLYTLGGSLGPASWILAYDGRPADAARLQGFAEAFLSRMHGKLDGPDTKALAETVAFTRQHLDDAAYQEAHANGTLMTLAAAVELLLSSVDPSGSTQRLSDALKEPPG